MGPWPMVATDSWKDGTPTGLSIATSVEIDDDERDDGVIKLCILALDQYMNNWNVEVSKCASRRTPDKQTEGKPKDYFPWLKVESRKIGRV